MPNNIEDKPEAQFIEDASEQDSKQQTIDHLNRVESLEQDDFSDIDESKVMRKIDVRLLPVVSVLYLLSYMDRSNIGNAKIEGLEEDLNLTSNQFDLCLTIFFISYSACEVPSNMILKKLGKQSVFISTIMVLWGIVMTCMGLVNNFAGLLSLRLLLGIFESGFYPAVVFGLTMYYRKSDMLSRQALFYSGSSIAGAFSGLLAFAISKMDGVGGYRGWRWIFILEGLLTIVVAFSCYWLLIDYPKDCKFLTEREKAFVIWRLKTDNNIKTNNPKDDKRFKDLSRRIPDFTPFEEKDDISMKTAFFRVFTDWQILFHILLYWGIIVPIYALSFYIPSVVKSLGYTSSTAQLMTIPIYVVASIIGIIQAFLSDYAGYRSPFAVFNLSLAFVGLGLVVSGYKQGNTHMQYGGLFIVATGFVAGFPNFITWNSNNLANSKKRAIGVAAQIGIGNFGGAVSSQVYKNGNYLRGHYILLGFTAFAMINCWILISGFLITNKKRMHDLKGGEYDEYTDEELFRMGDKSPFYKYRL